MGADPEVLVFGNGASGRAAAELLRRAGRAAAVLDGADPFPSGPAAAGVTLCVTSPGVPPGHPWQAAARARGIPVASELQLGAERLLARGARMLAVTGSKGKSSVVKLVAEGLAAAGARAVPCGNYGEPLSAVANAWEDEDAADGRHWAVVEVSSFQMETTSLPPDAFAAAAILNLQDDHLDRHGSREAYHALKRRLLGFAARAYDFSRPGEEARVPGADALLAGSYFDNAVLRPNGRAGVALMRAAGLDDAAVARAFRAFRPLPHRMQKVAETGGVRYIDDSKATSLAALVAGVEMAGGDVRLVAGGLPKGDNPEIAISVLSRAVKKVYLIGASADQLYAAWKNTVPCERCGTLHEAVRLAKREAVRGDTVLLSPGAASFDQFKSYGERGDLFAALVKEGRQG